MKIKQSSAARILAVIAAFCIAFTAMPMAAGELESSALSKPACVRNCKAVPYWYGIVMKWTRPTNGQLRNMDGIAVWCNGRYVRSVGKRTTSCAIKGLTPGTRYNIVVRPYRSYRQKQWYNKKTKKWEAKKPAARWRGRSRTAWARLYSGVVRRYVWTKGTAPQPAPAPTPAPAPAPAVSTPAPQPKNDPNFFAPALSGSGKGDENTEPNAQLSWGPVLSAQKFIVYRDNVKLKELSDTATGYGDFSVTWSETHTYKVSAVKDSSELTSNTITITIPAKPAKKEPLTPEYVEKNGVYNDAEAQKAYGIINTFRMTRSNQWYRDPGGDIYTIPEGTMYELQRDENLERAAKQRAKEMWIMHWICNHKDPNGNGTPSIHYRPDGGAPGLTYQEMGVAWTTENLAWGVADAQSVVNGCTMTSGSFYYGWAEENEGYPLQGHRRAMLKTGNKATKMGIACFSVDGITCWCYVVGY